MTASKKNLPLAEAFTAYLRARNMRLTSERMAVVAAISQHTGMFTADSLHRHLSESRSPVSLATVYNTVGLLCSAALINAMSMPESAETFYKVASGSRTQILQICDQCGKIKEVADRGISSMLAAHAFRGFVQRAATLCIHGMCARCSRQSKKK